MNQKIDLTNYESPLLIKKTEIITPKFPLYNSMSEGNFLMRANQFEGRDGLLGSTAETEYFDYKFHNLDIYEKTLESPDTDVIGRIYFKMDSYMLAHTRVT